LFFKYILPEIDEHLNPSQFSDRKKRSTEDAMLLLNNTIVEHLGKKNTCVWLFFSRL